VSDWLQVGNANYDAEDVAKLLDQLCEAKLAAETATINITGPAIIHTHPGQQLTFIINEKLTLTQAETLLHRLEASIPGARIVIADGIHQVIAEDTEQQEG
jgi:hypothetical protein